MGKTSDRRKAKKARKSSPIGRSGACKLPYPNRRRSKLPPLGSAADLAAIKAYFFHLPRYKTVRENPTYPGSDLTELAARIEVNVDGVPGVVKLAFRSDGSCKLDGYDLDDYLEFTKDELADAVDTIKTGFKPIRYDASDLITDGYGNVSCLIGSAGFTDDDDL